MSSFLPLRYAIVGILAGVAMTALTSITTAQTSERVRRLPLQGAPNFRDLGGYATSDGKHVRWGQVFRSGQLDGLTDQDYRYLAALGISAVCDFRADRERVVHPTEWQGRNRPEILALATEFNYERPTPGASALERARTVQRNYEQMTVVFAPAYGAALQRIFNSTGATLVHCAGGDARTGLFSALFLLSLGVSRDTVIEDYLLSNESIAAQDGRQPVDRSYLEAALRFIDAQFGSFENYRRNQLGFSDQQLQRLKARLLE